MQKSASLCNAQAIEPGKYTVISGATAAGDLLELLTRSLGCRKCWRKQKLFLSKKGGGNSCRRENSSHERVNIFSDSRPCHRFLVHLWDNEGFPQKTRVSWILEMEWLKIMFYTRYWAESKGVAPTGRPREESWRWPSIACRPDSKALSVVFGDTILVYPRRRSTAFALYGLTRAGTFYIENWSDQIHLSKNFDSTKSRSSCSITFEALGRQQRVGRRYWFLPMKIRRLYVTSLSDAFKESFS